MADSFERQVFQNLKTILAANLTWPKVIEYEKVRLAVSEFNDTQLPAVQFWFDEEPFIVGGQNVQRGHAMADIRITIEIVLKPTAAEPLNQGDLLDRLRDVREVLGNNLQLNIQSQMFHVLPVRATRDFVTQLPYIIGQLQISVQGQVPYGVC